MKAYCFKCKAQQEVKNPKVVTLKNGRKATKGTCSVCGAKVSRMEVRQVVSVVGSTTVVSDRDPTLVLFLNGHAPWLLRARHGD